VWAGVSLAADGCDCPYLFSTTISQDGVDVGVGAVGCECGWVWV
jgi:hypothetical protein